MEVAVGTEESMILLRSQLAHMDVAQKLTGGEKRSHTAVTTCNRGLEEGLELGLIR